MEGYSERHKVPTVKEFREIEAERERTSAANASQLPSNALEEASPYANEKQSISNGSQAATTATSEDAPKDDTAPKNSGGGAEEKERLMAQAAPKGKPAQFQGKGERFVTDPVTGGQVKIADSTEAAQTDPLKLDSRFEGGYSHKAPKDASKIDSKFVSPNPVEPGNILLQQFPAPVNSDALDKLHGNFKQLAIALGAAMAIAWFFTAFGAGWFRFFLRTAIFGGIGFGGFMALGLAGKKIENDLEDIRMHMHTQRGQSLSPPMPESVEWLNAAIAVIWKQINPEMFIPMVDQIEDVMQQSLPGIVDAVKISDVGHGTNAFRFVSFRGLADVMGDKNYPREDWVVQGKAVEDEREKSEEEKKWREQQKEEKEKANKAAAEASGAKGEDSDGDGIDDDDESGDFLCYEISFSYSAEPGKKSKNDYIHLLLTFFIGNDLIRAPFNVWAQVQKISGTIRLRAQMVQQPPYIRNLTFSLMGVPNIEVSVIPMTKLLPNVLDLPLISGFVKSSIAAAANEYVAPKSMTLNMAQMLAGDGIKKDTDAVGVLVVQILRGIDLSAQDANGSSDPYVVLSLAKFGRPLYSSRIIFEDLNPVWNETAHILIGKDDIRADETLSIQLWDSDKRSADDIVGRVQRDLSQLVKGECLNKMIDQEDSLMGFEDADSMQGKLIWRVGFFEKAKLNRALITKPEEEEKKAEKGEMSQPQKDSEPPKDPQQRQGNAVDSSEETDALVCPPDPKWPSGILSIFVDHIVGLERRDVEKGVMGKEREGTQGQDVSASGETPEHLPSGYVEMLVNDDIVYKTRVKPYTNMPYFSAGTEVFVRDWTNTVIRIAVRDSRMREHDPIMGIVSLKATDLFKNASQAEGAYSIQDGVGYGKVQASFVFKAVKLSHPKNLLGWDTATVELLDNVQLEGSSPEWDAKLKSKKIVVTTGDDTRKLPAVNKTAATETAANGEEEEEPVARIPVYDRYSSQLAFTIGGELGAGALASKPDAVAVCSLSEIVDDEIVDLELDVYTGNKLGTLARNHIDEFTLQTHKYEKVGKLRVKMRLDSGLDLDHEKLAVLETDRHEYEVFKRIEGMPKMAEQNAHANDDGVIDKDEQKQINRAKTEALHARHRGAYGYSAVRGSVWAKDNMKSRVRTLSNKIKGKKERDQTVNSEA